MSLKTIALSVSVLAALITLLITTLPNKDATEDICNDIVIDIDKKGGNNMLDSNNILNLLTSHKQNPKDKPIKDIQLGKIRTLIESLPSVKRVECYLTKSNKLKIKIIQRTPAFRIATTPKGYVDTERVFVKSNDTFSAYIPIISGSANKEFLQKELFDLIEYIEHDKFLSKLIQQINIADGNTIELTPIIGHQTILLGTIQKVNGEYNFTKRLDRLKEFYLSKVLNKLDWQRYAKIDIRFDKQVVCTKIR